MAIKTLRLWLSLCFALGLLALPAQAAPPIPTYQPQTLTTTWYHACAIRSDGSVDCWGDNAYGRAEDQPGPFVQVGAGTNYTCGLKPDGSVDCWGGGTSAVSHPPADPARPFIQIASGQEHACGLRSDGSVDCWGSNSYGQSVDQAGPYIQIAASGYASCGLQPNGSVDCWGWDTTGQAGHWDGPFVQVEVGMYHTCALEPDGGAFCWGQNDWHEADPQPGPFVQVSAGWRNSCGLKPDGSVQCWGVSAYGVTGAQPGPYTQLSAGIKYACGLKYDGSVDCWGTPDEAAGQLAATDQPAAVYGQPRLSAGGNLGTTGHTCAIYSDRTQACWGYDMGGSTSLPAGVSFTQLEAGGFSTCGLKLDGTATCWGLSHTFDGLDTAAVFTQLASGQQHTCGLRPDGSVDCWGWNSAGQAADQAGPYRQVSADLYHTCAIQAGGGVDCWGTPPAGSNFGQAADQPAGPGHIFTQVSAGQYHTCALTSGHAIHCWGRNEFGEGADHSDPAGFVQVGAGLYYTCGLKSDGRLQCWGDNIDGILDAPGGRFSHLSSGPGHACGARADGTLECWGNNHSGEAPRLALSPASLPGGIAGQAYTQSFAASLGTAPYTYQVVEGSLPPGLALSAGTGALSGAPTAGGSYSFVVQATDSRPGMHLSHQQSYTIAINTAPALAAIPDQTVDEQSQLSFTAGASDPDAGQSLSFSLAAGAPNGAAITSSGDFTWTPGEDLGGSAHDITVTVSDGAGGSAGHTFRVTVVEVNTAPTLAAIPNRSVDEGELLSFTATATDSDLPANPLAYSLAPGAPAGAAITSGGYAGAGVFTWTPTEDQGPAAYPITITVSDGAGGSHSRTFQVTVAEVNRAPQPSADAYTTPEDTPLAVPAPGLLANDSDPDRLPNGQPANLLSAALAAGPQHGALALQPGGGFTYTPARNWHGQDSFTYTLSDGALSATVTVTLTVTPQPETLYLPVCRR